MEMWVKPDSLDLSGTPGEVLMETGGTTIGMNISLVANATNPTTEIDVLLVIQDATTTADHLEVRSTVSITDVSDFNHILVTFDSVPSLFTFIRLENELSQILGFKVDLVMKDAMKPTIAKRVLDEVVPV